MFYPAEARQCRDLAQSLVRAPEGPSGSIGGGIGGIVPHAGWICSGAIAGEVLAVLAQGTTPDVVVVFGAVHTPIDLRLGALASHRQWDLPGGPYEIAVDLAESLEKDRDWFATDDRFHLREHAVEVEAPLIRAAWPVARLLPIEVPAIEGAAEMGRRVARLLLEKGLKVVFLASSDLTHYGPSYRFAPAGTGLVGLKWAKENDRRLLQRVMRFEIEQIVPEARQNLNACGPGAIAAMLAACREAGASVVRVLRHASSYETLARVAPQKPVDAVGYAGVIVE
jgi:AmmeMemoRadiSam system protein B